MLSAHAMAADLSQQGSLKIGDTLLLQVTGDPCGYVYSELSSSAYNRVSVFPVGQDSEKGPCFPNVAFATFKVIAPNKYSVQQEYNLLQQEKQSSPVQSSQLDYLLASTKRRLKQEQKANLLEQQKKQGTIVAYGDTIQLVHVGSKRYISLSSEYTSKTESNNLLVQLSSDNSEACIFKVLPRYKVKSEGDQVRYEDQIKLESLKTQGQFLHCSQRPLGAANVTLQSNHYELNLSALETAFAVIPHYSPTAASDGALRAGCCVRLFHREGECYMVAEGSFGDDNIVEQVHCRQRRVDQSAHSMPSSSANTYWQIEKESDTREGEVLYWEERCRIRHLPTRLYLTVQKGENEGGPKWTVSLIEKDDSDDLDTLFSFHSLLKEGETVQLESYARIKHLLSDTWLHLDVLPYQRQSYDPQNEGLAGIQWDSAALFQLTSCQGKGDYDAFTLQKVDDHLLDKFNYMAGIVPILKSYNESITLGTVTKKEGSQMVSVLKELHGWLEDLNTREAKTKQKLMRNLMVLEQLRDILKHPAEATTLTILHKSVCRECYSVISQYLKGDSRKNENYLARFIEFFQTQVGMELNAEELLVEIVQDNLDIVSRMAKTQIDHMIAQLRTKRDPRFLYFLSSLCVCSGKPIPSTQSAIIKKLVLPYGEELFIKTATRSKDVLCSLPGQYHPVNIVNLSDPKKPDFHFLEAQLHLFARLCTGNNEDAIEQLRQNPVSRTGYISFDEAFICAKSQLIHPTLKSRYVELILVMYVAVGENRSFLDHLCYSFVYSDLSPKPYEESGGDDSEALTGVVSDYFPILKVWILEIVKTNKVLVCDEQHISHNEVLAQILDLLCHLVNYGYYDDQSDINDVMVPLFELLDGKTDTSGKSEAENFSEEGRFKDSEANRAAFAVKNTALEVALKFLKFKSYVHLQVFIYDFKFLAEQGGADSPDCADLPSVLQGLLRISGGAESDVMSVNMHRAVKGRLEDIWKGSVPGVNVKAILIDLSRYENDDLVRNSLKLLTTIHSHDETLFSHAAHTQLLIAEESLAVSKKLQSFLPTLRHLLSVDGDVQSQWKIIDILGNLTDLCTRTNDEEPHADNQMMLYNHDLLSDILSFVLSKKFQQHLKEEQEVTERQRRVSQQAMTQEVLRNCFTLLHALAYKNELVQMRLFERVGDLLKVRMAAFAVADVLTEIFASGPKISMKVKEEDVDAIFETIIDSRDPYTQAQLLISLQALAKIEQLDLPMNSHQAQIVNNFCKYRQKIGEGISGEEPKKAEERWRLLTECDDDNPDLQLLLSMTDLLATCAEGDNIFIESVCQTLLPFEELMKIMCAEYIPVDRKRPFVRFLIWVYISTDGDRSASEGASLSHNKSLWSYLKRVAEKLHNFRRLLEVVPADNRGPYRRALVSSVRRRTYSLGHKSVTITSSMKGLPYFTKEDGSVLPGALEYFTEGIVPLLQNFFTILFDPTGMGALPNEGEIAVQVASALIRLVDIVMKFVTSNTLLQDFRSLILTICTMPLIEQKLKIDMETYNKLNVAIQNRHHSISRSTRRHGDKYQRQKQINNEFHQFAKNYQKSYLGPNTAKVQINSPVDDTETYFEEGEELPLGPNFQELVLLYYTRKENHPSVIPETERLLTQLEISISREEYLTEEDQQQQDMLDIRCLQVLRALIHNQIKMIDPEEEDSNPVHYRGLCNELVNPIQVAIQEFDNAAKRVLPLLTHPKEDISDEALSLLKTLLFSGNETVQKGLEFVKYTREERLFIFLQTKLRHSSLQYRETRLLKFQLADRQATQQSLMDSAELSFPMVTQSLPPDRSPDSVCEVMVTIDDDEETNHEKGFMRSCDRLPSASPARGLSPSRQLSLDTGTVRFLQSPSRGRSRSLQWAKDGGELLEMGTSFMPRMSNTPAFTSAAIEGQADISPFLQADSSTKLVLEVIGLMCDGQHRSMQDYLRVQPDNYKNVNIVAEVAEFLQTYTNGICAENYEQIKEVLQALIEMCVGNPPNQHVILEKQVVDPINRILQLSQTGKVSSDDVSVLEIKGKAVELLEVMLEETSPQSATIRKSLQSNVNVHALLQSMIYFRTMATEPLVKEKDKDDDAERGKFQCYHVLIALADSDGKLENVPIEDLCDKEDPNGNQWRKQSCSVEIHYKYEKEKHLLTKVHFFRDVNNSFREEVVEKIKWNIDRESMENKHRALVDLFEPLKKDLTHQQKLRDIPVFRVIKAFPELRHYLLLFITLLLNLFVLFLFTVPVRLRPGSPIENVTRPGVLYPSVGNNETINLEIEWLRFPLYILGAAHLFLAVWMVVEYFLINFPHFRLPEIFCDLINKVHSFNFPKPTLLDVNIFGLNTMWVLLFLICSVLSLVFLGYFYCICMLHIVFNNDILQRVLRSVTKNGKALLWVAFLGLVILLIYAVLSFAFMWDRFYMTDDAVLYCDTLFQCYVSIIRYGLIDNLGLDVPLEIMSRNEERPKFDIAAWRLLFDISFFIIVTTIGLNIVFGIIVDTFSELRDERSNIEEDQKSKCFICDLESHEFDRKAKGFGNHIDKDHNMWDYVYYSFYLDSIDTSNHTALQKYVFNLALENQPEFFPREEACCFEAEDDPVGQKLEFMHAEMARLLQRFRDKDASKSANAKKAERKIWEEKVLKPQQSFREDKE